MAKTANATGAKRAKVELVINAAAVTALASLTTAETIDISSIVKSISGGDLTRTVEKEYVIGDSAAIETYDPQLIYSDLVIVFLYTNGKDELGADDIDIGAILDELAVYVGGDLSLPVIWSMAGGNVGDEERQTGASDTRIVGLTQPQGGVDTTGKVQRTLTLSVQSVTKATVS